MKDSEITEERKKKKKALFCVVSNNPTKLIRKRTKFKELEIDIDEV